MTNLQTLEIPVAGMDCTECTQHVQQAIAKLPGVESVKVLLSSEKAIIRLDPARVQLPMIQRAVEDAGYSVPDAAVLSATPSLGNFTRRIVTLLGVVFGAVLLIVVIGEWFGLFAQLTARVPFLVGLVLVILTGWPIFRNVLRAALKRQVTSHMLMTLGVLAALAVGQWVTAAIVVFFMRVAEYTENFTTEGARRAVKDLTALTPQTARVERAGAERLSAD